MSDLGDDDLQPGRTLSDLRVSRDSIPLTAAQFQAICGACFGDINPGDRIVLRNDAWIHEDCQ
jgi:hypothetical protein